jgi:hypothetical protein
MDEQRWLALAQAAVREELQRAQQRLRSAADNEASLRELRDAAAEAREDDLPQLFAELAVRQKLRELPHGPALPDPANPYFAHLQLREERGTRDYLLGQGTLFAPERGLRIVDWRSSPVAKIFYRYREGDEYEETFPGRDAVGTVMLRRIVVIENGELTRLLGGAVLLERDTAGRWKRIESELSFAGGGAGSAVRAGTLEVDRATAQPKRLGVGARPRSGRDITALLDPEQFAAVSAPPETPLLVLGSAGSGKTTVALHRLARLAAQDPKRFPLESTGVLVPEEGLARLSRRLLEPLGVGEAQVLTLDEWALGRARHLFGGDLPPVVDGAPGVVASLKRHPATFRALKAEFAKRRPKHPTLRALKRRLLELLSDRDFLSRVVADAAGTLSRAAIDETRSHAVLQLRISMDRELLGITDESRKLGVDGHELFEGTPDEFAGALDVEDVPILLCLYGWCSPADDTHLRQLVIDEAEDVALFELAVLRRGLVAGAAVTLAGDEAQQTTSCFAGWEAALHTLGLAQAETCRLTTSYRCPRPVSELAQRVLGPLAPASPPGTAREGAPVGYFRFPDGPSAELFAVNAVRELLEREPQASVAVLARDAEAARRFYTLVEDHPAARLVERGDFSFDPGLDVTLVDAAKGLEFDYVVVPDATAAAYPATDEARRRLHMAMTRASHQLWLIAAGSPTTLLP